MLKTFLAASAAILALSVSAGASVVSLDEMLMVSKQGTTGYVQEARRGRGSDDAPGDDRGGDRADDSSDDDNNISGSGRKKPRIPGGSGCDDPGDVAEHPSCSPQ